MTTFPLMYVVSQRDLRALFFMENKKHTFKYIYCIANMFNALLKFHQETSCKDKKTGTVTYLRSAKQLNLKFWALVFNILFIHLNYFYIFFCNANVNTFVLTLISCFTPFALQKEKCLKQKSVV